MHHHVTHCHVTHIKATRQEVGGTPLHVTHCHVTLHHVTQSCHTPSCHPHQNNKAGSRGVCLHVTHCHVTHHHVTHIKATGQEVRGICLQEKFVQRQETCHLVCVHCRPVGHQRGQANKEVLKAWRPLEGRIIVGRKAVAVDLVVHRHMLSDSSTRHSLRGFLSRHHKTTELCKRLSWVFSHHLTEQSQSWVLFLRTISCVFSVETMKKREASPQKWRMWRKGEASPWKWRMWRQGFTTEMDNVKKRRGFTMKMENVKARLHHRNGECEEKERLHHENVKKRRGFTMKMENGKKRQGFTQKWRMWKGKASP